MQKLVENILKCSSTPENWNQTLDIFNETFQISASCMYSAHEFKEFRMGFNWSKFWRESIIQKDADTMYNGEDTDDIPAYHFLFQNPSQRFYTEPQMFEVDDRESLPASSIRDLIKRYGLTTRTASALNKSGPWIDFITCQHPNEAEYLPLLDNYQADFVLPIMANSLSLGRTLRALHTRYEASLSVLDELGVGVFLVDATGCVIQYNKEAQRIIDQSDGLSINTSKRLALELSDKTRELEAMINGANNLLHGEMNIRGTIMASTRPSGAYEYLISVRSLFDSQSELERGLRCAFVTVIDPAREGILSSDGITALAGLTEAESEVVELLVQGYRSAEIAEMRGVTTHTSKAHLKAIFQKLRCSTQSDIIRAAAATRIPLEE